MPKFKGSLPQSEDSKTSKSTVIWTVIIFVIVMGGVVFYLGSLASSSPIAP